MTRQQHLIHGLLVANAADAPTLGARRDALDRARAFRERCGERAATKRPARGEGPRWDREIGDEQ